MAAVRPSPTSATLTLAAELRAAGRDVLSLGAGEPDFDTPEFIKDAAIAAIRAGATKYTPIDGMPELKVSIIQKFVRDNGLKFSPQQVIVTSGAKQALFNLCLALLGPGDEVIVPAPYWVSYPEMVRLAGADVVTIGTDIEADFKITAEQLDAAITPQTRLLVLNSPSNPTGASYTADELRALGQVLEQRSHVAIVSDEIYEAIHWGAAPFTSFASACPALGDRTVTVNGVSKAYAMTGWRIGYAAGPEAIIAALHTVQSQSTSNACSVSQVAAAAALDGDQTDVRAMTAAYRDRHDWLVAELCTIPGFQCRRGEGTFYAFPRITAAANGLGLPDDQAFANHLVHEAGVITVPGTAFGAPGHLRLSFACPMATLHEAVARIRRAAVA